MVLTRKRKLGKTHWKTELKETERTKKIIVATIKDSGDQFLLAQKNQIQQWKKEVLEQSWKQKQGFKNQIDELRQIVKESHCIIKELTDKLSDVITLFKQNNVGHKKIVEETDDEATVCEASECGNDDDDKESHFSFLSL